jgi:8-oxo-dGTP pyrophosphatase MutT (NUDIX family)
MTKTRLNKISDEGDKPWQTLDSKVVYKNPWMTVREDKIRMPSGSEGIYGCVEGKPGVFVIAVTSKDEIYLVESFRHPTQEWQWELPSGGIDAGVSRLDAAKHELSEELGILADKWTHVNIYTPSHNGFMDDTQDVFVAEGLRVGESHLEETEAVRAVKAVPIETVLAMIKDGTLVDGQSLAALMQYVVWRGVMAS